MPSHHSAFSLLRTESIPSLNITIEEYQHKKTGAQHIHLQAENNENVFLVALRTVPHDSTGVAHILEHTALCGSKRYPVRDPFFMMTRRSLNTFMNAFTSSDWTAYPFASTNRKDFDNLLDVYLDAVFFSRLDPLDFAQEGHRLEFSDPKDPNSDLEFKGVVYNEMKGAMSSVSSMLWHTLGKYLHPATTYHYNSGGEPDCIPDLTYEELVSFYKTHYHPSNAIFMTYGDIPAIEHQTKFEDLALSQFELLNEKISVPDEKRFYSPIRVEEAYPVSEEDNNGKKTHVVVGWLLGRSADLKSSLAAQLLSSILLDNSASPLMHALETSDLGNAPSPLCGLDDSHKELTFVCGLEGCADKSATDVENLILSVLQKVAEEGIPQEDIEASLHQLELHQREIGGDHYPYGLQIILNALTAATHRGDPVSMLNVDQALNDLRDAIQDPNFVKNQIQTLFLDNPHRVQLSLRPDANINQRKEAAEKALLAKIKSGLSDGEKQAIIDKAIKLEERQTQKDDESILPKVTLDDVPEKEFHLSGTMETLEQSNRKLTKYNVGSNGLVYQQVVVDMPNLLSDNTDAEIESLPFYTACVTELGVKDKSYLDVQRWQARVAGSLNAFSNVRCKVDDIHQTHNYVTFSGKALVRNHNALCDLMSQTLHNARFDEHGRIRELVAQMRASREQSVTGNGHGLAMLAAASGQCAANLLGHRTGGLEGIKRIKALDESLNDPKNLTTFCENLATIHEKIAQADKQYLLIGEPHLQDELVATFAKEFDQELADESTSADWQLPKHNTKVAQAWLTNSQVNFCAKAYPTVCMTHPDAAPLIVLGNVLRNGFLHRAIREKGGAYGGGASQDNNSACFKFYSYRDPRLEETLLDFDSAIDWVINENIEWQAVEEAILGVVSGLDKPDSPAGAAKRFFHADLHGRTQALRQTFRERLLATQIEDVKRVADTYLKPSNASTAVVTDTSKQALVDKLGLETIKL